MKGLFPLTVLLALFLPGCTTNPALVATINMPASLLGKLPANPLQWQVLTSFVDPKNFTMSTLYGNDIAVHYAGTSSGHDYPDGSQLALVTWTQREDPRWFGANIPDRLQCIEFVSIHNASPAQLAYSYQRFEGSPLKLVSSLDPPQPDHRTSYLLSLQPSLFP